MNQIEDQSERQSFLPPQVMDLQSHVSKHKFKYIIIMSLIGLINNTGYVMVGSASSTISEKFDKSTLMGMFQLALIMFSSLIRFCNMKYWLKFLHRHKVITLISVASLGYIIIAVACSAERSWGFYISLVGSVFCGSMQALGEGTILGFLKAFPAELVGGFSSGTGLAGVFGSMLFILLKTAGVSLTLTFLCLIPLQVFYYLGFVWYEKKKTIHQPNIEQIKDLVSNTDDQSQSPQKKKDFYKLQEENSENSQTDPEKQINQNSINIQSKPIENEQLNEEKIMRRFSEKLNPEKIDSDNENDQISHLPQHDADASQNLTFTYENFKKIHPKIIHLTINISLVYFFEYCCITGFASHISGRLKEENRLPDGSNSKAFFIAQSYEILNFSYQLGVFLSRSSLELIKVPKVQILTFIQGVNFLLYFSFAYWNYMPMYGLIPVMLWTGLMGGCSYVNVNYQIINSHKVSKQEKEMAVNISNIYNDIGVLTASLFSILADSVILKNR